MDLRVFCLGSASATAKESAAKKLARQRRLELRPSSSSSHGQGLSSAYPTSAIDMLGQKLLYKAKTGEFTNPVSSQLKFCIGLTF